MGVCSRLYRRRLQDLLQVPTLRRVYKKVAHGLACRTSLRQNKNKLPIGMKISIGIVLKRHPCLSAHQQLQ